MFVTSVDWLSCYMIPVATTLIHVTLSEFSLSLTLSAKSDFPALACVYASWISVVSQVF